ncbi:DedA family protein [Nostocoides sp. F2B08]|uniref:DedA family protein n=1 Tax=Nostocoides sp. F2B08 TaxID=2653936 RepID=UPI00186ADE64|nr:DedA family protein [Tetrasphaera sp. F2B08]
MSDGGGLVDGAAEPTARDRRVLSPRRPWFWILVAVGLLLLGAGLRDLALALSEWEPPGNLTPRTAYVISALLVFADGVCAIFPAETTLITTSTLAVQGLLDLPVVILAGAVGAITGDSALYWLARLSRRRFQRQLDAAMRRDNVAEAMDLIGSSAPVLLVVGRYVPGLRFVVNATCGLTPYPYRKFLLWSSIGGTLWSIVTCLTAYLLGTALGDNPIAALVLSSLVSTFAVAIVFVLIRRHRAARKAAMVTNEPA